MAEYAVSMTHTLAGDVEPEVLDAFIEILGDESSVTTRPGEIGVTTHLVAEDFLAAQSLVRHLVRAVAADSGLPLGECVEAQAIEADRNAAQLEESNLPDLVSSIEVAEILGVSKQRVYQLNNDHAQFPPPLLRLASGPIWLRATIEAFDRTWTRKPGRPAAADQVAVQLVPGGRLGAVGVGSLGGSEKLRQAAVDAAAEGAEPR